LKGELLMVAGHALVEAERELADDGVLSHQVSGGQGVGAHRHGTPIAVRRRRVLALLGASIGLTGLLGSDPQMRALWWVAATLIVVTGVYAALLVHVRNLAAAREWSSGHEASTWDQWSAELGVSTLRSYRPDTVQAPPSLERWALVRFCVMYLVGWLLTPLVAIAELLAGGAAADSRRQRWLEHLIRIRQYGREQSRRAITVSVAATAGVASFGPLAGVAAANPRVALVNQRPAAGAPAAPAPAPGRTGLTTYTVQAGDTLSRIAARHATTWQTLASINHLANPNYILVGQRLVVSGSAVATPAPAPGGGTGYIVQTGDTLSRIAARYGTTWQTLASMNHLANGNYIYVGEKLSVPGGGAVTTAPPPVAHTPAPPPAPAPAPAPVAHAPAPPPAPRSASRTGGEGQHRAASTARAW
jgi:LysM repeat protein